MMSVSRWGEGSKMTPKNWTLGGRGGSKLVENRRTSFMYISLCEIMIINCLSQSKNKPVIKKVFSVFPSVPKIVPFMTHNSSQSKKKFLAILCVLTDCIQYFLKWFLPFDTFCCHFQMQSVN